MRRYAVAAALLFAYAAGSVWAVRHEGVAYRESLRRGRLAVRPLSEPSPSPPAAPAATRPVADLASTLTPASRDEAASARPAADVPPVEAGPALPSAPPPVAVPEVAARPPGTNPLLDAPEMKRVWDLTDLTTGDEKRLGQALHALVLSAHRKVETGPLPRRVEEAAEPFVAARSRKDVDYTFTVLDSDAVNAFSHPGGYVYVTSGLMNWVGEDQIYALEFALAHEVAHVDLRHAVTCLRDPGVKSLGYGTLPQFLLLIFPWGYSPERLDYDADRWAFDRMTRLGRSKRERLAFLRKLEGFSKIHGFENGRTALKLGPESAPAENHLRAHPAAYKRLKSLESLTPPVPTQAPGPALGR